MNDILTRPSNIKATIICDSINKQGVRITTMELEYPRFIHSELMTHRMFSRNASSSRAVPTLKAIEQVEFNMAMPLYWGSNQSGMQAGGEISKKDIHWAITQWRFFAGDAIENCKVLSEHINVHKQHAARLIEPFQMMKTLVTATEWDNFYNLRLHPDAQPEIMRLAYEIHKSQQNSVPVMLNDGGWHLPYVETRKHDNDTVSYCAGGGFISIDEAIKISASCCAQVSYRKTDTSLEKADAIFDRLIKADVLHSSPFEHLATPASESLSGFNQDGITHIDRDCNRWSGNFKEWIQYRHNLPENTCSYFDFHKRMEMFK